jgi:endonuclease-3
MKQKVFKPPRNWEQLLSTVTAMRRGLEAPVDTIGCHKLHDSSAPVQDQRFQILVALMLSSQTRDQCTSEAMRNLRRHGLTVNNIIRTPEAKLQQMIHPVCFHNNKARFIKQTAEIISTTHRGKVPESYEALVAMPGLGPKMVHLYLQTALNRVEGIGVDVHVHRIARRFRWVPDDGSVKSPEDTRKALEAWLPREHWKPINELLVGLGQTVCLPRFPKCANCAAQKLCPSAFIESNSSSHEVGSGTSTPATSQQQPQANTTTIRSSTKRRRGDEGDGRQESVGNKLGTAPDMEDLCAALKHTNKGPRLRR